MADFSRKETLLALGKGLLLAAGVTIAGMIVLATLVVFVAIPDTVLLTFNQLLKVVSIFIGVKATVGAGGQRGFALGGAMGLVYMVLGYGLYCITDGGLANPYLMAGEFLIGALVGAVSGALVANLKPSKASRTRMRTKRV